MNVLIVGSGGREHALAWKLRQSPQVRQIFCAPGNGGIAEVAECAAIEADDLPRLVQFAKERSVDLTVVGPEGPLVQGIVDEFKKEGLRIFGPQKAAARLEGSKIFAKEFMARWRIPTAGFRAFDEGEAARRYLDSSSFPVVIKADGLASGKGVFICTSRDEGRSVIEQVMGQRIFKDAGARVVIEECLRGEEASIMAVSDGRDYVILESSQDHKRIFDDDLGPNTGGMGAYSPAPVISEPMLRKIEARVIEPVIRGMREEGHPFQGVLYAGLMITEQGPQVLEFNVRFGDPETQVVLPRLESDLLDLLRAGCDGGINRLNLRWDRRSCVCVVMSSGGYPGHYDKGKAILGLETAASLPDTIVFHAGTRRGRETLETSGGRVLGVTALGNGTEAAIRQAYQAVEQIHFERCFFRRDIGARALKRDSSPLMTPD